MTVDLFTIACTTCKSRLKVRDQAAIGQILACPKCGGMVMVKPPPSWSDSRGSKAELPTASEVVPSSPRSGPPLVSSAFDAVDDLLSDAPPRVQSSSVINVPAPAKTVPRRDSPTPTPTPAKPRFLGGPPVPPPPPPSRAKAPAAAPEVSPREAVAAAAPAPAVASDSAKLAPPPPGETVEPRAATRLANVRPWRFWLVTAGSAAVGIVLAFAAVTVAIYFMRNSPTAAARHVTGAAAPANPIAKAPDPIQSATGSSIDPQTVTRPVTPVEPAAPAAETKLAASNAPPAVSVSPQSSSDPLGIVNEPAPSVAPPSANDPLAKFDRLIGGGVEDPLTKSAAPPPAVGTLGTPPDQTPLKPVAPRPPAREIDIAKRLADPLLGIETSATPLADFLQNLLDYSTIPISLELDALPIVKVTAETPVVLKAANTNVGGALAEALRPLKLEHVVIDDQLVVRMVEPNPPAAIEVSGKDLTDGSEQQLGELAELLRNVVEPASWGSGEGAGEIGINSAKNALLVRNRRAVQTQVLLACDKLRVARGKPNVLKLDAATFKADTRWARAKSRLETPVSLNYSQPTRLLTVLDRLGAAAGVRILVDWRDVAGAGWNPAGEAILVADKQSLAAALDALLSPLDLTWRVVDSQTLELVTPARLAERVELELYPIPKLVGGDPTGEKTLAKVRAALGEAAFRDGGGSGEIRFDLEGKCLLAALPQPKQRELEALVAKWTSDAASK